MTVLFTFIHFAAFCLIDFIKYMFVTVLITLQLALKI